MQATTTFGRRGSATGSAAPPRIPPPPQPIAVAAPSGLGLEVQRRALALPWVTLGILAALIAIFVLEAGVSAAGGHPGKVSHSALVKLGGLSRDLVLGHGQVWRVLTVSLLHLNPAHLIGNAVALVLVGLLLEPIVGRGWFALIYVVGGIGGALGSLAMNPGPLLSVGASGAIMCLLSCSLVLSLHAASFERRRRMQILSLRVMVPALLPLSGAHGHVDYSSHIGGVIAGMVMGFLLQILWAEDRARAPGAGPAGLAAGLGMAAGVAALALAALLPSSVAATAGTPGLVPADDTPANLSDWTAHATQLAALYPNDPRPHVFKALDFLKAHDDGDAEVEFLSAQRSPLLAAPELPAILAPAIRSGLIGVYLDQGRMDEARAEAAPFCSAPGAVQPKTMALVRRAKLCDPT